MESRIKLDIFNIQGPWSLKCEDSLGRVTNPLCKARKSSSDSLCKGQCAGVVVKTLSAKNLDVYLDWNIAKDILKDSNFAGSCYANEHN